jgi:hypothetical protein
LIGQAEAGLRVAILDKRRGSGRFSAIQTPPVEDPVYGPGDKVPGVIQLCLKRPDGSCSLALAGKLIDKDVISVFADFHALRRIAVVYPLGKSGRPLLLVQTGSTWSGDSDVLALNQLLDHPPGTSDFRRIFYRWTGSNNNEETRYIERGPLRGDVISAVPTSNLPYGFWITVDALTPAYAYRRVLRYRSATIYNDGNPIGAIDSEMPNIQRRLGLWHVGMPLPVPAHCPKPHLIRTELWCN